MELVTFLESDPSKKDDLESLAYVLAYFFLGGKLWETGKDVEKSQLAKNIEKAKLQLVPEVFCHKMPSNLGSCRRDGRSL